MKLALFVAEIFIENKIYDDAKNRFDYLPLNCGGVYITSKRY